MLLLSEVPVAVANKVEYRLFSIIEIKLRVKLDTLGRILTPSLALKDMLPVPPSGA